MTQIIAIKTILYIKRVRMNIAIEKNLQQFKTHIIDHATISSILVNNGYTGINDKINKLKKEGLIQTLKRGLYLHKSPFINTNISKEIIANTLLSPSYISFDYALYFYGLIPESVFDVTSATTKRSKSFKTDIGVCKNPILFILDYQKIISVLSLKSYNHNGLLKCIKKNSVHYQSLYSNI